MVAKVGKKLEFLLVLQLIFIKRSISLLECSKLLCEFVVFFFQKDTLVTEIGW